MDLHTRSWLVDYIYIIYTVLVIMNLFRSHVNGIRIIQDGAQNYAICVLTIKEQQHYG
jgi:hypothetical protein